jgi:hypothetical protein
MVRTKVAVTIKVYQPYAPVLQWLQDNVGPLLHCQPIIFWHGQGWHMRWQSEVPPRGLTGKYFCSVEFDDQKTALWFDLVWG